jgi:hypothetical protein
VSLRPFPFYTQERTPVTLKGRQCGPRSQSGRFRGTKKSCFCRYSNPKRPAVLLYQLYTFTRAPINCWNGLLSYQRKCLTIFDQVLDLSSLNSRLSMTPHENHVLCSRLCKWISCSHAFVTLDALLCSR